MNKKSLIMVVCLTVAALCLLAIVIASVSRGSGDANGTTQSGNVTVSNEETDPSETGPKTEHGTGLVPEGQSGSGVEVGTGDEESSDHDGEAGGSDEGNTPSGGGQQGSTGGNQGGTQTETTEPATGSTEPSVDGTEPSVDSTEPSVDGEDPTQPSMGSDDSDSDANDKKYDASIDANQLFDK